MRENRDNLTKELLNNLFISKEMSISEISEYLKIPYRTILGRLNKLEIRKIEKTNYTIPTKEQLEHLYFNENKSTNKISKDLILPISLILNLFKKYNIIKKKNGWATLNKKPTNYCRVEVKCHICETPFMVKKVLTKICKRHSCSKECAKKLTYLTGKEAKGRILSPRIKIKCKQCEIEMYKTEVYLKNTKNPCCSPECSRIYKSINQIGENNPNWKGTSKPSNYGYNWQNNKKIIKKRDKTCKLCGSEGFSDRDLHVHHCIPFRLFDKKNSDKANTPKNLILLCDKCHPKIESINRLIWTQEFFNKSKILETIDKNHNKNFHCYSIYK